MFVMVTGGSGSGKSAYAESRITDFETEKRYYIATMKCEDAESKKRIARHRAMRAGKGFMTVECPENLCGVNIEAGSAVLLECMSNLTANEFFREEGIQDGETVKKAILDGIDRLQKQCALLVVVTNEVFSDGRQYDPLTESYLKCLGEINQCMAKRADEVVEVVYSIPVMRKKRGE